MVKGSAWIVQELEAIGKGDSASRLKSFWREGDIHSLQKVVSDARYPEAPSK
jgi:hypothetical protein